MNRCEKLLRFLSVGVLALVLASLISVSLSSCRINDDGNEWEDTSESKSSEGQKSEESQESEEEKEGEKECSALQTAILSELDSLASQNLLNAAGEPFDLLLFKTLVSDVGFDESKLSYVEQIYRSLYIGEFRSVTEAMPDLTLQLVKNYRPAAIKDYETMTGVIITAYAAAIGDKYASYFSASEFEDYMDDLQANYTGIGVQVLRMQEGYLEILQVYPETPALEVGLREGDIIVSVEGADIAEIGYNEAVSRVRGEEGTYVNIGVRRGNELLSFRIRRQKLVEYSVDYKMMSDRYSSVGYIRINEFDDGTPSQFIAAYRELSARGAQSFVFDVRANPGGELESVVAVLEYILPYGEITTLNYAGDANDEVIDSVFDVLSAGTAKHESYTALYADIAAVDGNGDHKITKPITVLLNEYTASAGELFSSAIRDYAERDMLDACLIGQRSYGKGTGQSGLRVLSRTDSGGYLWDGAYINVSTFTYDPPFGENYEGEGVTPHETVLLSPEAAEKSVLKLQLAEDAQLLYALEYLIAK